MIGIVSVSSYCADEITAQHGRFSLSLRGALVLSAIEFFSGRGGLESMVKQIRLEWKSEEYVVGTVQREERKN